MVEIFICNSCGIHTLSFLLYPALFKCFQMCHVEFLVQLWFICHIKITGTLSMKPNLWVINVYYQYQNQKHYSHFQPLGLRFRLWFKQYWHSQTWSYFSTYLIFLTSYIITRSSIHKARYRLLNSYLVAVHKFSLLIAN